METTRQQKIAKQIQKDISEIFQKEGAPIVRGTLVTVTGVRVSPDFSYAKAVRYLQNYLAGHDIGEIEAVVCNNDAMALGIIDELQHRGYNEGDGSRYIPVVGIDATEKALNAVKDGSMVGTVYNNAPAVARTVVRLTSLLTRGEEVNVKSLGMPVSGRQVMVPYVKVTLANVGSLRR